MNINLSAFESRYRSYRNVCQLTLEKLYCSIFDQIFPPLTVQLIYCHITDPLASWESHHHAAPLSVTVRAHCDSYT